MRERGFEKHEILSALIHPDLDYPAAEWYPPDRRIAVAGRVAVVYCPPPEKLIITVLFRGQEPQPGIQRPA